MSIETDLVTVLRTCCPDVFPLVAPISTLDRFVVYQQIGGDPLRYTDGTAADRRMVMVQVASWARTKAASITLARQIEDALSATGLLVVEVSSEVIDRHDEDSGLYGSLQDFSILGPR